MPAIFPGFEPLGAEAACPSAESALGVTLAVLVMVVPSCVTVITEGTRLETCVGEKFEVVAEVVRVVGAMVGAASVEVKLASVEVGVASSGIGSSRSEDEGS